MISDYRQLAQLFTSSHLKELSKGKLDLLNQVNQIYFQSDENILISKIFDESFQLLSDHYANEYIYKNLIIEKLFLKKHSTQDATFLTEFRVGKRKVDCVILNGKSTCYEIKTEFDSLQRLDQQLDAYQGLFNEVYVVCAPQFTKKLLNDLPLNIGIIEFSNKLILKKIRKSKTNNFISNKKLIMESMRQTEYTELASRLSKKTINIPNMEIYDYCHSIIDNCQNERKLNKFFIETLKKKRKNDEKIINSFPTSLTNAVISYKFLKSDLIKLAEIMQINHGNITDVLSNTSWQTT